VLGVSCFSPTMSPVRVWDVLTTPGLDSGGSARPRTFGTLMSHQPLRNSSSTTCRFGLVASPLVHMTVVGLPRSLLLFFVFLLHPKQAESSKDMLVWQKKALLTWGARRRDLLFRGP
jgi:hypothetical protein